MTAGGWIILTGCLVAASCGFLGCFLVLRRLAMLGDALSHALLLGIVGAFLATSSRAVLPLFVGAVIVGLLTTFFVQSLAQGGVQGDAAIGVTFTSLFALGVVLVSLFAGDVDLDLECVLYGEILYTPFDILKVGMVELGPRAVWVNGGLALLNLLVVGMLYKELKLCSFDPAMAAAVGINVPVMHYLLMGLVSVTTVGAFESVGAILVVAMLIVPGATAYLLTDRLERMLGIAIGVGILSSVFGYFIAQRLDCSIAGAMAAVCGVLFAAAFFFSPSHGVLIRTLARQRLRKRVAEEDLLLWAVRRREVAADGPFSARDISSGQGWLPTEATNVARRLERFGMLARSGDGFVLTPTGLARATEFLRRHRLYETHLSELGYPDDHLHAAADRVEHHIPPAVTAAIDAAVRHPERDPQGKPIPPAETD